MCLDPDLVPTANNSQLFDSGGASQKLSALEIVQLKKVKTGKEMVELMVANSGHHTHTYTHCTHHTPHIHHTYTHTTNCQCCNQSRVTETFEGKTEFSQEKYLNRKKRKYEAKCTGQFLSPSPSFLFSAAPCL